MSSTTQVRTLLNSPRGSAVAPGYQPKVLLDNKARNVETMVVAVEVASSSAAPSLPTSAGGEDRPIAVGGQGDYIRLSDGRQILDACGGAAVTCLGHGNQEVIEAMAIQASQLSYAAHGFFDNNSRRDLAEWFKATSQGHFRKAWVTNSGSEAMEGAMKLAHEYFVWKGEPNRLWEDTWHDEPPFEPLLLPGVHRIPPCNEYRQRLQDESDGDFVLRKVSELEKAFLAVGPETVTAFIAEPVVGAASGCVPAVPGYFQAMKAVCDRYGALLILDEVMSGMGRTGTLHAWEQEGIVPDIQAVGKGLAAGYQPVSAILAGDKVSDLMDSKGVAFTHGHTYQDHPLGCATALKVQQIVQRDGLLANVQTQGAYLEKLLKGKLSSHPHVGNIRGRGLFWGIEFVKNKATKEPFDGRLQISQQIHATAMAAPYNMAIYYGQGCAGEKRGDHVMLMPAYNSTPETIRLMVDTLASVVEKVFADSTVLSSL
ncbi:aminotransferase- class III [Apiospora aurea]|uniref:Aminotransferase- class III n=1 Tax=Apiospora aurea TaxID=335848 RepID=A0ABR1PTZ7_9PEZI